MLALAGWKSQAEVTLGPPDLPSGRTGGECRLEQEGRFWRLAVLEAWRDTTPAGRMEAPTGCHWRLVPSKAVEAGRTGRHSGPARRGLATCTLLYPGLATCTILCFSLPWPHPASLQFPALPCPALPCPALYFPQVQLVAEAGTVLPVTRRVQSL